MDFTSLRYGLFVHYGLFSLLERGEWVMNRERLDKRQMQKLAASFDPSRFDAETICDLAVRGGMRYVVLTTMHHEGFRLYRSELSDFSSWHHCQRDLVAEMVTAARKRGLKVGLYHSLNNWFDSPDAVDALEDSTVHSTFLANTHARLEELVHNYDCDILWYDGWWPFDGNGWQGDAINAKLRAIRPGLIFNARNGAEGDFATPEQHITPPTPWRPWEACITLNDNWGYHAGDDNWKSPKTVLRMIAAAAAGNGNLLLNIGPRGDGSIPEASVEIIETVGKWMRDCYEAVENNEVFSFHHMHRDGHRGDWSHQGPFTASGNNLYLIGTAWVGGDWSIAALETKVEAVHLLPGGQRVEFSQDPDGTLRLKKLASQIEGCLAPVLRITCADKPVLYNCGGMRVPKVAHAPYDPLPSDLQPH